jgi:hypothetical protein
MRLTGSAVFSIFLLLRHDCVSRDAPRMLTHVVDPERTDS